SGFWSQQNRRSGGSRHWSSILAKPRLQRQALLGGRPRRCKPVQAGGTTHPVSVHRMLARTGSVQRYAPATVVATRMLDVPMGNGTREDKGRPEPEDVNRVGGAFARSASGRSKEGRWSRGIPATSTRSYRRSVA